MTTIVPDYLYSFQLEGIDNFALFKKLLVAENIIVNSTPKTEVDWYGNLTSAKHHFYNIYTFPIKELYQLYFQLREKITPLLDPNTDYVLKGWLNVFRKGEKVNWHAHWPAVTKVWHGFYCVNVGENKSATLYRIPGVEETVTVPSKNGLLVVGKSEDDRHTSTAWTEDTPRITLAFDIIPMWAANPNESTDMNNLHLYHYIPFISRQK